MKTNKSILDVIREAVCPSCGMQMTWREGGTNRYVQAGELVENDYEGYWTCECGYSSDEDQDE